MSADTLAEPATNFQVRPTNPPQPAAAVEIVVISLPSATKRRQWISSTFEGTLAQMVFLRRAYFARPSRPSL